jgi:ABC-2 type transport system ATP-binding protein
MDSSEPIVIETTGLSKSYNGITALKNLDMKVPRHSIFGFLGPNGAGKTTTIKLLLGLAKPSSGSGSVFGLNILNDNVEIRKRVGYLAQDQRFYEYMTARETLRFTARFFYSGPPEAIEERVSETLELVGLSDKADRSITGFSGGERQRLGIAQAQINYPDLLILDEPAASLDPMGRRDVLEVMERLRKYSTIFYSTHILDDVQKVSDMVAILNHGELIAQAPIEHLLAGSGNTIYTVSIEGNITTLQERLQLQPWITNILVSMKNGNSHYEISVSDEGQAKAHLLRLILDDPNVIVIGFARKTYELEDIFMQVVAGSEQK